MWPNNKACHQIANKRYFFHHPKIRHISSCHILSYLIPSPIRIITFQNAKIFPTPVCLQKIGSWRSESKMKTQDGPISGVLFLFWQKLTVEDQNWKWKHRMVLFLGTEETAKKILSAVDGKVPLFLPHSIESKSNAARVAKCHFIYKDSFLRV